MKRLILIALLLGALRVPIAALSADDYAQARLSGIASAGDGAFLLSDAFHKVLWLADGDAVSVYAGAESVPDLSGEPRGGYRDGTREKALFTEPWAVVRWLDGYAVSDTGANVIRYVTDKGVSTLCGSGKVGNSDGVGKAVKFNAPTGLASDGEYLYIADAGNGAIRRVTKSGAVSTWARGFSAPTGLCWYDGALYIAETGLNRIVRYSGRDVTLHVVAGIPTTYRNMDEDSGRGFSDGPTASALFDHPQGIAVGDDGAIYVADTLNAAIRVIRAGRVDTLARGDGLSGPVTPRGLSVQDDTLYVADLFAADVQKFDLSTPDFSDVPQTMWCSDAVREAVRRGLTNGVSATAFNPNGTLTRAMFVAMLSRLHTYADGAAIIDGDATFPDLPASDAWYSGAARWAADCGAVNGIGGQFAANSPITRKQICAMLYRYAQYRGFGVSKALTTDISAFADADSVTNAWAIPAIKWAVGMDILHGRDGWLMPDGYATRAQTAQLLINFMDAYGM